MRWVWAGLLLLAGLAAGFSLFILKIGNMMTTGAPPGDGLFFAALGAVALLTLAGLAAVAASAAPARWALIVGGAIVVVTLVPHAVAWTWMAAREGERIAANRETVAKFRADLEARGQDVEARIAARRPYGAEEAMAFVKLVQDSNLAYVHGPDLMPAAMPILQRALEGKVLDPNILVASGRADIGPEPLFVHLHRWLRQDPKQPVRTQDWNLFLLLTSHGADLSRPDAQKAAADLRKQAVPAHGGLYLDLK